LASVRRVSVSAVAVSSSDQIGTLLVRTFEPAPSLSVACNAVIRMVAALACLTWKTMKAR
jgi:hypothetical protein